LRSRIRLYSNAHRGKMGKADTSPSHPSIIKEEDPYAPSKGWAEMIRKVYEIDPLLCPESPPPPQVLQRELLTAVEERGEYF